MQIILADAGVPMFMLQVPAMVLALVPVVLIEAIAAMRLYGVPRRTAFSSTVAANAASTVVGVPVAYIALFCLDIATNAGTKFIGYGSPWQDVARTLVATAWLPPDEKNLHWMVPLATTAFLVPTFFISVFVERPVLRGRWPQEVRGSARKASWVLNALSYGFLLLLGCGWLIYSLITHKA